MTKKDAFIKIVEEEIFNRPDIYSENYPDIYEDAAVYFEALKGAKEKETKKFTENGKLVLSYMQEHKEDYNNLFTAKSVGDGLGVTSRTASGAMRKLTTDGYLEKLGENPVSYSLTPLGIEVNVDAE